MRSLLNTLSARLLIGSAIPLVLFVGVGLIAAIAISHLLGALALEKRTHEAINKAFHLQKQVDRMGVAYSTGAKGVSSPAYRRARASFEEGAEGLAAEVTDNPEQQQRVAHVLALEKEWHALLLAPSPELLRAEEKVAAIEREIDRFIEVEEGLLANRRAQTDMQARQSIIVIAAAAGLALLLTFLLSVQSARSVTGPIERLREAAGQLVQGHFRTVPPTGPREVAELIVHFNHMALTLSERIGAVAHILWTTNAAGEVVADLPTWRAFTGQAASALLGAGWFDAVHPEDRAAAIDAWRAAVANRAVYEAEYRLRSAEGAYRHFACRGVPLLNRDGSVREWIGTCTDITERKQRAALREAMEAAEASSRAKSEFLARMSHELRTPLNAVIGMSKMLLTQRFGRLNAKQADYLGDITKAGEHLLALINDILDLAKVEAGKLEAQAGAFDLAEAAQAVLSTLRPLAEARGVALGVDRCATGTLHTDTARVRQVLYNLLSNAIKFTPARGRVALRWDWIEGPHPDAPVVDEERAGAVRVAVRDTGIGIAAEDQPLVWEEFRQVKTPLFEGQQGTGLGLALTRRLVRLLGGTIWLESELGKGSTFTFVLPRRLPAGPPAAEGEEPLGPERIQPMALVIEDHPPTHKLLADWLGEAGFVTASAFDGAAGLEQARKLRPQLIVLDIQLPKLDGWQVLTELKADPATRAIPVVVTTVTDDRLPTNSLGVQEFFIKPIDREDFLRRLRSFRPGGARILLAEDEPATRKLLGDMLRAEGATVVEADNGRAALERLGQELPDLIVLDLMMPEMDGFAVVEEVRERPELNGLPVLVVTSRDITVEDRHRLNGRIHALLKKERLTPEKLRQHLEALGLVTARG
jgi:PAS domain S-box-containing protein